HPPHAPSFPTRRSSDLAHEAFRGSGDPLPPADEGIPLGALSQAARRQPVADQLGGRLLESAQEEDQRQGGVLEALPEPGPIAGRSEEHTSELQSPCNLV